MLSVSDRNFTNTPLFKFSFMEAIPVLQLQKMAEG